MSLETLLLYFFAAAALAGGVLMLVARHPMRVALALISSMVSLAGIYAILGVHVIAVFQVLIYVGAVMVFMVYVIMLLDVRDPSFLERYGRALVPSVAVAGSHRRGARRRREPRSHRHRSRARASRSRRVHRPPSGCSRSPSSSSISTGCTSNSPPCCCSRPSSPRSP